MLSVCLSFCVCVCVCVYVCMYVCVTLPSLNYWTDLSENWHTGIKVSHDDARPFIFTMTSQTRWRLRKCNFSSYRATAWTTWPISLKFEIWFIFTMAIMMTSQTRWRRSSTFWQLRQKRHHLKYCSDLSENWYIGSTYQKNNIRSFFPWWRHKQDGGPHTCIRMFVALPSLKYSTDIFENLHIGCHSHGRDVWYSVLNMTSQTRWRLRICSFCFWSSYSLDYSTDFSENWHSEYYKLTNDIWYIPIMMTSQTRRQAI